MKIFICLVVVIAALAVECVVYGNHGNNQGASQQGLRCNGQDDFCCTLSNPCQIGEGDCDFDDQCAGPLVCGNDNCPWGDGDDCCTRSTSFQDKNDSQVPAKGECKVDLGFLLDSSGSIQTTYQKEKEFIKRVVAHFKVGQQENRVGVVTFSNTAELSIKFKDHNDVQSLNQAVDKIPLIGSYTRIDLALRTAEKQMFTAQNGTRNGVQKVLVVITDGTQTIRSDFEKPDEVAKELRQKGFNIHAVGVGRGINEKELKKIAGKDGSVYTAETFDDLLKIEFIKKVQKKACKGGSQQGNQQRPQQSKQRQPKQQQRQPQQTKRRQQQRRPQQNKRQRQSQQQQQQQQQQRRPQQTKRQQQQQQQRQPQQNKRQQRQQQQQQQRQPQQNKRQPQQQQQRPQQQQGKDECQVDLGFLLDSSGSIQTTYKKEKEFVKRVVAHFKVGQQENRVGVVTFSNTAELSIKLKDHNDVQSFNEAVDKIPLIGSYTRIALALRTAEKQMFTAQNGTRNGVPKVLIVITDGTQTFRSDFEKPDEVATELRQKGLNIHAVGVGRGINEKELKKIAGKDGSVYTAETFDDLLKIEFIKKVQKKACKGGSQQGNQQQPLQSKQRQPQQQQRKPQQTKRRQQQQRPQQNKRQRQSQQQQRQQQQQQQPQQQQTKRRQHQQRQPQQTKRRQQQQRPQQNKRQRQPQQNKRQSQQRRQPQQTKRQQRQQHQQHRQPQQNKRQQRQQQQQQRQPQQNKRQPQQQQQRPQQQQGKGECQVDLGFLLDSSGSIQTTYKKEKEFVKQVVAHFKVGQQENRVGVVTFSNTAELSIKLKDHNDVQSFNEAVDKIPLIGSYTRIALALRTAEKQMFTSQNGTRNGVPKVLIVITDGTQTFRSDFEKPDEVATELRQKGLNIHAVGVGRGINEKELKKIAGKDGSVYTAETFDDLLKIEFIKKVQKKACKGGSQQGNQQRSQQSKQRQSQQQQRQTNYSKRQY